METANIKNEKSEEISVKGKGRLFVNNLKENLGLKVFRKSIHVHTPFTVAITDEGIDIEGYYIIQFTNAWTPTIEYEVIM